jgi:hypothetical protein
MKIFIIGFVSEETKKQFINNWKKKCNYEYINFDNFYMESYEKYKNSDDKKGKIVEDFYIKVNSITDRPLIIDGSNIHVENTEVFISFRNVEIPCVLNPSTDKLVFLYEDLIRVIRLTYGLFTDKQSLGIIFICIFRNFLREFKPAQISDSDVIEYDIDELSKLIDIENFSMTNPNTDVKTNVFNELNKKFNELRTQYITDTTKPKIIRAVPRVDKLTKFINLSNFTGGSVYYNKYIKYKNKYLKLRDSISNHVT